MAQPIAIRSSSDDDALEDDLNFRYGNVGDIPVVGDWNGDSTDTIGTVHGTTWNLRNSNTNGTANTTVTYGQPFGVDIPVVGDWNGDGSDTVGVVTGSSFGWALRNSNTSGVQDVSGSYQIGIPGNVPIVGRWQGASLKDFSGAVN